MGDATQSTLITFPPSSGCETVAWLLERYQVPVRTYPHSVPFFSIAIKLAGGFDYPFLNYRGQKLSASRAVVNFLEAMMLPERKLAPADPADAVAAGRLWNDVVNPKLGFAVPRWAYGYLLPERALTLGPITKGVPAVERLFVSATYPLMARLIGSVLGLKQNPAADMEAMIRAAFDAVEARLAGGGDYLFGDRPSYLDFGFAGLAAPAVLAPEYGHGGLLPSLADAPAPMHPLVTELRERPGGKLIERLYAGFR